MRDVLSGEEPTGKITAEECQHCSPSIERGPGFLRGQPAPDVDRLIRTLPCVHFPVDQSTHWRQTGFREYNLDQILKCSSPAGTISKSRHNKRISATITHIMSLPHFHTSESVGSYCHMVRGILPA
jgi:hypothetical protein